MNKRIKELLEQAGMVKILEEHASEYGNGMFENTPYPELEKFTELIVKDCADYVQFYYKDHMCEIIAHDMKTHFGVEL